MDKEKIAYHVRGILEALGEDPEREGLRDTPQRVARMYEEVFEGISYTNHQIAEMFGKTFSSDDGDDTHTAVVMKDITVFSFCEHHMALMYDMKVSIAYLPNGTVLGLSKLARIADMCAKRLQLQERLGADIAECIQLATGTEDVMVVIEGKHACMTTRGLKSREAVTRTATLRGAFKENAVLRQESYRLMNK